MNQNLCTRVKKEAEYLLQTKKTIREVAIYFGISKSTVHKDMQERLVRVSPELHNKVHLILAEHLKNRHIKGGETTKQKYLKKQASG